MVFWGIGRINGTATACGRPISGQSPSLLLATMILGAMSIVCVGIRLLQRPKVRSEWLQKADDWMMGCNAVRARDLWACLG